MGEIVDEFSKTNSIPVTVGIDLLQGKLSFLEVQPSISYLMYISLNNETITVDLYEKSLITSIWNVFKFWETRV